MFTLFSVGRPKLTNTLQYANCAEDFNSGHFTNDDEDAQCTEMTSRTMTVSCTKFEQHLYSFFVYLSLARLH